MPESSVIHDIGYQRYTGPRLGRGAVFGAIYVHGLRAAYGLGRSAKAKIFPWLVVGIVTLVAVILAAVRAQTGLLPLNYIQFADAMSWLIIFFVAIVAPELVSRDMRSGVLPLYFSRPLRAADYIGAKVAAMVTAVWALLAVPQFIIFLGAAFTTKNGMSGVWNELGDLLPAWGYSLLWALVFTGIGLLIASLTGKRAFAAGGIVAVVPDDHADRRRAVDPAVARRAGAGRSGQPDDRWSAGSASGWSRPPTPACRSATSARCTPSRRSR